MSVEDNIRAVLGMFGFPKNRGKTGNLRVNSLRK
jgi:hypothetical protein